MRALGLDVGDKTIGIAVADGLGLTAQGVTTIFRRNLEYDLKELDRLMKEYEVNKLVVGMPKSLDGTLKRQAEKVMEFVEVLKAHCTQEIVLVDERLSTVAAERTMREMGTGRKDHKLIVNQLAAQWILQGYLDRPKGKD